MMDNLGDFKCLFCNAQVLITDLREYLSAAKYKQLADKEISHLFDLEIAMLDATKAALDEEQRIIEMEIVIKWLRKDGMDDTQILHALVEMGYMKEGPSKHLSFVHMCPKCNELLPTGSAARRAEGGALPRKPQALAIKICWKRSSTYMQPVRLVPNVIPLLRKKAEAATRCSVPNVIQHSHGPHAES